MMKKVKFLQIDRNIKLISRLLSILYFVLIIYILNTSMQLITSYNQINGQMEFWSINNPIIQLILIGVIWLMMGFILGFPNGDIRLKGSKKANKLSNYTILRALIISQMIFPVLIIWFIESLLNTVKINLDVVKSNAGFSGDYLIVIFFIAQSLPFAVLPWIKKKS